MLSSPKKLRPRLQSPKVQKSKAGFTKRIFRRRVPPYEPCGVVGDFSEQCPAHFAPAALVSEILDYSKRSQTTLHPPNMAVHLPSVYLNRIWSLYSIGLNMP